MDGLMRDLPSIDAILEKEKSVFLNLDEIKDRHATLEARLVEAQIAGTRAAQEVVRANHSGDKATMLTLGGPSGLNAKADAATRMVQSIEREVATAKQRVAMAENQQRAVERPRKRWRRGTRSRA
jgi:23S rRNA pseudoU1915 N3-methylase RlmH